MTVLVTGGAGFLGTRLVATLLAGDAGTPGAARVVCVDRVPSPLADPRVVSHVGSITDAEVLRGAMTSDVTAVWHLAAVLSGQAEAEFDVGMAVNLDGTRTLLEACRTLPRPPRFVFASTIAVFGGDLPDVVPDDYVLRPQSSYGTAKAMAELLVLDCTRRGIVDGVVCRVPTVSVRPGVPNSAVSSFVSGIIREPLAGLDSVCPVPVDTRLWVSSPAVTTANLAHAGRVDGAALGALRTVNLPGITVTPRELLDSLERLAGAEARARVRLEHDERISRIVGTWPGGFDVTRAIALGFTADRDADALVRQFMDDRGRA